MKDTPSTTQNAPRGIVSAIMAKFKESLRASWPFLALFAAVAFLDLILQREVRSQLEEHLSQPFFYFLDTAWVSLKWGMLLTAPTLFLGKRSRPFYLLLWPYIAVVETVEAVARCAYGMSLDGDWLMIVYASSPSEMREFFGQFGWGSIALTCAGLSLALFAGWTLLGRVRYPAASKGSIFTGILFCLPFALCNLVLTNPLCAGNELMISFLPIDTVHNHALYSDIVRTAREPRLPPSSAKPEDVNETLGVFVIGESATRSHWHLYGYGRPTTPIMDSMKDDLVVFRDARALHASTGKSLRDIFTEATEESPLETRSTFAQQCAAAGYRCDFISAQSRWGRWEGIETMIFSGCSTKLYLREQPDASPDVHDDALIPLAVKSMHAPSPPGRMVFLHLMGSHAPPLFRYPLKRTIYPRHEDDLPPGVADKRDALRMDLYDNTIAFTDFVLGELIDALKPLKRPSFLLYLSDHGETPASKHWRDASSPDLLEVPVIVWFSPEYRARHPETVAAVAALAEEPIRLDKILPILRILALL